MLRRVRYFYLEDSPHDHPVRLRIPHQPRPLQLVRGRGARPYTWAYIPGNDPFRFKDAVTHTRMGNCRNCNGTGLYDARRDPTIPQDEREAG